MKKAQMLTLDIDVIKKLREKKVNISGIVNEFLINYVGSGHIDSIVKDKEEFEQVKEASNKAYEEWFKAEKERKIKEEQKYIETKKALAKEKAKEMTKKYWELKDAGKHEEAEKLRGVSK